MTALTPEMIDHIQCSAFITSKYKLVFMTPCITFFFYSFFALLFPFLSLFLFIFYFTSQWCSLLCWNFEMSWFNSIRNSLELLNS